MSFKLVQPTQKYIVWRPQPTAINTAPAVQNTWYSQTYSAAIWNALKFWFLRVSQSHTEAAALNIEVRITVNEGLADQVVWDNIGNPIVALNATDYYIEIARYEVLHAQIMSGSIPLWPLIDDAYRLPLECATLKFEWRITSVAGTAQTMTATAIYDALEASNLI